MLNLGAVISLYFWYMEIELQNCLCAIYR